MQVEAIYEQGKLEFVAPVKLKPGRIRLVVQIPDEDVVTETMAEIRLSYELPPEVLALAKAMEERLDRIREAPPPADEALPPLNQKKLERIEAFTVRDEIRGMR